MAKLCPDCVYYNDPDSTCRRNSPIAALEVSGQYSTNWPPVKDTDWCAEGYNDNDGTYNPQPQRLL